MSKSQITMHREDGDVILTATSPYPQLTIRVHLNDGEAADVARELGEAAGVKEFTTESWWELESALNGAVQALEGDSNDAEHDALYDMAGTVAGILGVPFDPRSPYEPGTGASND